MPQRGPLGNAFGGAVFAAVTNVTTSVFRANRAVSAGIGQSQGGGIYGSLTVQVNATLFEDNAAVTTGVFSVGVSRLFPENYYVF